MAKIIITFNEIRESTALANTVADAIAAHTGSKKVCGPDLSGLDDKQLAEKLRSYTGMNEQQFIHVGYADMTIDIPQQLTVGYMKAYGKLVERVVPLGVQIFNIGKSIVGLFKLFENDVKSLINEVIGTKPITKE